MSTEELPSGWSKLVKIRGKGKTKGREDIYIFSPDNAKIRSNIELKTYLTKNKSKLTIKDFKGVFSTKIPAVKNAKPSIKKKTLKKEVGKDTPVKLSSKRKISVKHTSDEEEVLPSKTIERIIYPKVAKKFPSKIVKKCIISEDEAIEQSVEVANKMSAEKVMSPSTSQSAKQSKRGEDSPIKERKVDEAPPPKKLLSGFLSPLHSLRSYMGNFFGQ